MGFSQSKVTMSGGRSIEHLRYDATCTRSATPRVRGDGLTHDRLRQFRRAIDHDLAGEPASLVALPCSMLLYARREKVRVGSSRSESEL